MTDELEVAVPHCPVCLVPLESAGSVQRPYWVCPSCGQMSTAA